MILIAGESLHLHHCASDKLNIKKARERKNGGERGAAESGGGAEAEGRRGRRVSLSLSVCH